MASYERIIMEGCMWQLLKKGKSYHLRTEGEYTLKDLIEIIKNDEALFGKYTDRFRSLKDEKAYIESFVDNFNEFSKNGIADKINRAAIKVINTVNISYETVIGILGIYLRDKSTSASITN